VARVLLLARALLLLPLLLEVLLLHLAQLGDLELLALHLVLAVLRVLLS